MQPKRRVEELWGWLFSEQAECQISVLDCSHYVHNILYKQIYEESINFINRLKKKMHIIVHFLVRLESFLFHRLRHQLADLRC